MIRKKLLLIIFLIGIVIYFLGGVYWNTSLIVSGAIIMFISVFIFLIKTKPFRMGGFATPYTITSLDCPKCGHKGLQQSFWGGRGFPQLYACPKCGYSGAVALNPEKK